MNARTVLRPTSARLADLKLSSTEAFVFTQIDGTSPLADVAELTGVPLPTVIAIARRLEELGVAVQKDGRAHSRRPTVREQRAVSGQPRALSAEHLPLVPRRSSRDVYGMKLDPEAVFLLSRVDGHLSVADLADVMGWTAEKVLSRVEDLVSHGAVEIGPERRSAGRAPVEIESPPPRKTKAPAARAPARRTARPVDPSVAEEIEAALLAVAGPTNHSILGVSEGASAKEIRRAYHARAATLHADRYFGKELGPYRKKLDAAFRRVTEAYEAMRREAKLEKEAAPSEPRPAEPRKRTMRPSKSFRKPSSARISVEPGVPGRSPSAIGATVPEAKAASQRAETARPPRHTKQPKKPSSAQIAAVKPPPNAPPPSPPPPPPPNAAPPSPPPNAAPTSARQVVAASKVAQLLADAQKAMVAGDALAASNAFRLAHQLAPDAASQAYAESGLKEARSVLADSYAKAARAAEKDAKWPAAVAAYGKAVHHRPNDPDLRERLANALREEGHDLARAAEMAEAAVARIPRRAAYRRTLARIHAQAGDRAKAIEQLEAALSLEEDPESARLLATLRKSARR